jgi:hypothetical protein
MENHKTQPVLVQMKRRKWRWIDRAVRKPNGSVQKPAQIWNTQGARRRGRPRKAWKRTVQEEEEEEGKIRRQVRRIGADRIRLKELRHKGHSAARRIR